MVETKESFNQHELVLGKSSPLPPRYTDKQLTTTKAASIKWHKKTDVDFFTFFFGAGISSKTFSLFVAEQESSVEREKIVSKKFSIKTTVSLSEFSVFDEKQKVEEQCVYAMS